MCGVSLTAQDSHGTGTYPFCDGHCHYNTMCAYMNIFITQDSIECSICYQGNDEGGTPGICCDNCSKYYHKGCIVEVLQHYYAIGA